MNEKRYDLHMHTYYSDGRASPRELLEHAASLGLAGVAITDHDNARGAREAEPVAAALGLTLVPGMEFSCYWRGHTGHGGGPDVDVLGYFLDLDSPELKRFEEAALKNLQGRVLTCLENLNERGYPLTLEEVQAENPRYSGFVQLIQALHHRYGLSRDAALALLDQAWRNTGRFRFHIDEVINVIHAANGVAVLAHPSILEHNGEVIGRESVAALVEMGLDAVEVYHHRLDEAMRAHFLALAKVFSLPVTGGSDEHGWPRGFPRMASETVGAAGLAKLKARRPETRAPPP